MLASRLGYRITAKFARTFLGRVFDHPARVFDEAFLRPETQDLEAFVDGVHNITEAQQRVARQYFEDGSIDDACPPLRALLTIMAEGSFEGKDAHHPDIRRHVHPRVAAGRATGTGGGSRPSSGATRGGGGASSSTSTLT